MCGLESTDDAIGLRTFQLLVNRVTTSGIEQFVWGKLIFR